MARPAKCYSEISDSLPAFPNDLQDMKDKNFLTRSQINSLANALGKQRRSNLQPSFTTSKSKFCGPNLNTTMNGGCLPGNSNLQPKANTLITRTTSSSDMELGSPNSLVLSFENSSSSDSPPTKSQEEFCWSTDCTIVKPKSSVPASSRNLHVQMRKNQSQGTKRPYSTTKSPSAFSQDYHVIAERKRREKLGEQFVALTAMLPGIKKMSKASVLAEATKRVKQLEERIDVLEEQTKKKKMEYVVLVKQPKLHSSEESSSSSCEGNSGDYFDSTLPHIEAKAYDKNVLIRIHCEKRDGVLRKIQREIENLHLSITNSRAFPFGKVTFDITIIAEMEKEFSMTMKDLVSNLRLAFLRFV